MKEIINVTDIVEYLYCPRKVYLRRVKKLKSKPNKAMMFGFLKHKIFDVFNKNEQVIVSSIKKNVSEEDIFSTYKLNLNSMIREVSENYSNILKTFGIDIKELSEQTLDFLQKDINLRVKSIKKVLNLGFLGKELWRNLKPKYLTEFEIISGELGLKGRIDRIKFEDKILPYEIKTREEIFESDKIQLAAYSLLLEQEFGKEVNKGVIETRKGQEEIEITKQMKEQVMEIAEKIRYIKEGKFHNNFNRCKSCMFKKECFEL